MWYVNLADDKRVWEILTLVGRAGIHAAVADIRGHGADSHLRRSLGSLRVSQSTPLARLPLLTESRLIVALILNTKSKG